MKNVSIQGGSMPRALGPYSQVVQVGDVVYVSGQTGIDASTGAVPEGGFEAEARRAFLNLADVLAAAGSGLDLVAKTTVFLTSADNFAAMNALYGEFFPHNAPVRSTPIVGLPRNLQISIEAVAVRREA
jgi:2-iminobutanoate/2-iminopropanoate deaminase